ncbi:PREDICTED: probable lysophospholipase BODYGUARD 4 [Ipomoea nil]|uniref:probable lysophospholipase BODYGUARD 4 n=1 Tax=Ipomoea nil TaxID=35883 RepID=UPI0009011975|nr:PREDICTED: probable lysophospholipase BODYGUARD 4 [Ipomoea nil]
MPKFSATFMAKRGVTRAADFIITLLSFIVFLVLDFLDALLCVLYRFMDAFLEGTTSCYCSSSPPAGEKSDELSETLRRRKNVFRRGILGAFGFTHHFAAGIKNARGGGGRGKNRWSDCGCESCVSWMKKGNDLRLHFVVREPSKGDIDGKEGAENVIFLHGFIASSSFWTQTVFPNLSEDSRQKYRLFAVDLLGFGKSPKPMDCLYTIRDHIEMIERTVIIPFQLKSFHLVAHSMGCVVAVALAANYSKSVKSITLIAPPYFPCSGEDNASVTALEKLAARRVWPPLLFGSAFMSWYEHLGRCVCFLFCRNHRAWERILKLITRRDLHFLVADMTRHTHHSAWHSMHNVICGGAKVMDEYLETLRICGVKMKVIQGSKDQVVPLECSSNMKMKVGDNAEVKVIANADHSSVVVGREEEFTRDLEQFWASITTSDNVA